MKMLLLISTLTLAALGSHDRRSQFNAAMGEYAKNDGLLQSEPPQVVRARYNAFCAVANMVDQVNADDSLPYMAETNFLSILTEEEKKQHLGLNVSGHESSSALQTTELELEQRDLPESVDYSDKISNVKNQGNCGSCWTFAATAALEGEIYFKNSKKKVSLSEQEYIECAKKENGCNGGWMEACYTYTMNSDRIAPTDAYGYEGKDRSRCNAAGTANAMRQNNVKVTGNTNIKGDSNLLKYAAEHIVSVAVFVNAKFQSYKSGVYTDNKCNKQPNHAVAVVGYEPDNWKVRNSWGTSWGDRGYIKMTRKIDNVCGISDNSHIPKVECRNNNCKAPDGDDGDDDDDDDEDDEDDEDGDDEDDEDDDGDDDSGDDDGDDDSGDIFVCTKKISLSQQKFGSEKNAERYCETLPGCPGILGVGRNFYAVDPDRTVKEKNFIEIKMACRKESRCNEGLVFCGGVCKHEHMCPRTKVVIVE